jgi:predicted 3-demethylubiquinone-9 3-methyltransferase (glyoxalase superfamily)
MATTIFPCLWFDGNAKDAASLYCSIFNNARITTDKPMLVQFEIEGLRIMGLNGGPMFRINPSISLMVTCVTNEEIENIWNRLIDGGKAMMALDKYPWAEKYGWLVDKFGMTWQLMLGDLPAAGQKITPSFLFVGAQYGNAQKAIQHYASIFTDAKNHHMELYKEGEPQPAGNLKFGHFHLGNAMFAAMDGFGMHEFQFNEAVSLVVECDTQNEIDHHWNRLTEDGVESRCGWLKDQFGVSWQIIPKALGNLMNDPARSPRVMQAIMGMQKLDLKTLEEA